MIPHIRFAGISLLLLAGAMASMAFVRSGSLPDPDICYVSNPMTWQQGTGNPAHYCGSQTPTHQLSTSHSGGQDCTMSWTVTLSGTCSNGSGSGVWGLKVSGATVLTTGTSLPNVNPNPSSLGAQEYGIGCEPGGQNGRTLESILYEGAWETGTFMHKYLGIWTCLNQ